ncbi:MAG: 50S ribosomal protein L10 [Nitrospinae bacterium]|nr:50S ribosomal protein L10 [Nitrospinota bacterium]
MSKSKAEGIEILKEKFTSHGSCFVVDYRGLTVEEITTARQELRKNNATLSVIKNTLARKASEGTSFNGLSEHLKGPSSIIFTDDDVVDVAKTVIKLDKDLKDFEIKVAVLEGNVIDTDGIKSLSKLPPKEVLIAQLLGTMNAPIANFASGLNQIMAKLVYTIKAIEEQKAKQ